MNIKNKSISIILPPGLDKKVRENRVEDIYTKPWIHDVSKKREIQINSNPSKFNSLENSTIILIGKLPYFWPEEYKALISGFTHIIIDKYFYQSSRFSLYIYQKKDVSFILRRIYKNFKPGRVIVNSSFMKKDFESGFKKLGWDVEVRLCLHPITDLSLEKANYVKPNKKDRENYILYDADFKISRYFKKRSDLKSLEKYILEHSFLMPNKFLKNFSINALLGTRRQEVIPFHMEKYKKIDLEAIYRNLLFAIPYYLNFFNKEERLVQINKKILEINSRWKPSSKVSAAMALKIPYLGPFEYSNFELSQKYNYPAFFYDKVSDLSFHIKKLINYENYPTISTIDLMEIKNDIDNQLKNSILED